MKIPQDQQQEKVKILFVEDDPYNTELFVSCFAKEYDILTASSAEEALKIFDSETDITMVLSDQNMPGMNGVDLLSHVYARDPDVIRIIITGYLDILDIIDAINKGRIYQFILKPWDLVHMQVILERAAKTWLLTRENRLLHKRVLEQNRLLTESNQQCKLSEENLRNLSTALFTAREDEQKRISMELHDELGQSLAALKLQIGVMKNDFGDSEQCPTDEVIRRFDRIRGSINDIIESVRRLSRNLSPVIIDDLGLDAALENIVRNFTNVYDIKCIFKPTPLDFITSSDGQLLVYRLVQESLNNIGKHSAATQIYFTIDVDELHATLNLTDNGKGFDFQEIVNRSPENKGIGLTAMKERVNLLGGNVDIQSNVGGGTSVTFTIPRNSTLIKENLIRDDAA